ncbi:glycoside hydrolase family 13 protein [Cutibacterium equinum]|uniref:Glycoside hydrolase family 13 protein n=1 Tax=Cutibacterium equinum TaxID=3016342 RepID=A0ABY7QWA3_9ACTN|nr:glycoside hydrolase family 13 protein [Cutibacterium equinum]WCC79345.1 glycoside hydrolase family 13 protein [Cutibacterium equinum]
MTAVPTPHEWWTSAVVYQVYPRSFADSNGDGTGDICGIIAHLDHLVALGVDALWISPWYPSPLADGGYDVSNYCDINPDFGTLDDADALVARAHELGLRVIVDLVPNHSSQEHPWFKDALAAPPGSPERDRYIFRDGRGSHGEFPPNNWPSVFGGSAWQRVIEPDGTPGQWYLHLFDISQPDWNWENPEVVAEFDRVLRFWFDRGVDGFRIDVANSMVKESGLPDLPENAQVGELVADSPMWDQPGLASIQRRWRAIADEYANSPEGPRMFVAEAYLPHDRLVRYLESDRLHTSFNFEFLLSAWSARSLRTTITDSLAAHESVGASATWVLGNHDNFRPVSRYGKEISGLDFSDPAAGHVTFHGTPTDVALGRRRARAAVMLELALPGCAYIYQGEELGLPEVEDLPDDVLQDPTWERSGHTDRGRDGCRVPIPWRGSEPPYGWSSTSDTWLPMPHTWADWTVEAEQDDPSSFLTLYRALLAERRSNPALGTGTMTWDASSEDVLDFSREPGFRCVVNFGDDPVVVEPDKIIVASTYLETHDGRACVGRDQAVWLRV